MSDRDLVAWAAEVTGRLDALGASSHEVHLHKGSTVIKIRRLRLLGRWDLAGPDGRGREIFPPELDGIPDGEHLGHVPERDAAVLTLYRSGTAMWQGEPGVRAWAREIFRGPGPAFAEDAALGATRVAVP